MRTRSRWSSSERYNNEGRDCEGEGEGGGEVGGEDVAEGRGSSGAGRQVVLDQFGHARNEIASCFIA